MRSGAGDDDLPTPRGALRSARSALRLAWLAAPGWLACCVALTLLAALVPVVTIWLLKSIIDALTADPPDAVLLDALGLVGVGLLGAALPASANYVRSELGRRTGRRAQSELYHATERLAGLRRIEDPTFRDQMRMAQQGGRSGPGQVVDGVLGTAQKLITLTGLVVVLATISPVIAAVTVSGLAPALVAEIHLSRTRSRMMWRISPTERRELFYAELQTSLRAAKEVRLLGLSGLFRGRMLDELAIADGQRRRMDGRELRVQVLLGLLSAATLGVGLVWAVTAAGNGALSIGDLSAFVAAITAVQSGLGALVGRVAAMHHALLIYDHYRAVLRVEPDLPVVADPRPLPPLRTGIELRDVWFRYGPDKPWILRGVDLDIPHGTALGLVGVNGAGKSTLVKLLCRFYDPERGTIRWDGVDLRDVRVADLRERIGTLFQDYMSYDLSAAENIGLGDVSAPDDHERIRAAAVRADIDSTIQAFPRGYRTLLSRMFLDDADDATDSGVLLSGGQWQRLALARTFLRDGRDLLILDEPSSGLDAEAEYEIHHRLRRHRAGATSVLISHRLGAVREAGKIVVLDGGRVREQGTHDELLATDGVYARLFRMQADGYRTEPVAEPAAGR